MIPAPNNEKGIAEQNGTEQDVAEVMERNGTEENGIVEGVECDVISLSFIKN